MNRHRLLAASHLLLIITHVLHKQFKQDFIDIYLYVGPSSETDAFKIGSCFGKRVKNILYTDTQCDIL